jgi:5-methylcytosine-specific restriction protein A
MRPYHQHPVMSRCFDEHRVTAATLTDHVVPHRGDQILFWDEANWQSMCGPCHKRKTDAGL